METDKSQAYNYAYEVLPLMFHAQTTDFVTYIQKDGLKFLKFWWDYISDKLPEEQHRPWHGVSFDLITKIPKVIVIILTLPEPRVDGEVYYLGFIRKPEKRFAWVRLPSTRIVAMVRRSSEENPQGTELGDLTPRARYVRMKAGPAPSKEAFTKIVLKLAQPPAKS